MNYVRANPGKVNYATGNGTSVLATAQLALTEKLDMQQIPYKGDAPSTADLIAGRVQVMIGTRAPCHKCSKEDCACLQPCYHVGVRWRRISDDSRERLTGLS